MNIRLAALAGVLVLSGGLIGCATDQAYYGPAGAYGDVDYDAYYDGAYGPFVGGYWGAGDQFYYWSGDHQHYHRDVGGHFQRQGRAGFNAVHGHAPAAGGGRRR